MPHSLPERPSPDGQVRGLTLNVPNELAAIETTRSQVLDFLRGHSLSERTIYRLELVLEETLMNRLMHAFPDGGAHFTRLSVQPAPPTSTEEESGELVLCFEDDGVPFDPLHDAPPAPHAPLADAPPGGFGLMLTRKAARACHYERIGERNRFTVRLATR